MSGMNAERMSERLTVYPDREEDQTGAPFNMVAVGTRTAYVYRGVCSNPLEGLDVKTWYSGKRKLDAEAPGNAGIGGDGVDVTLL